MESNLRERFFMQYYGQRVLTCEAWQQQTYEYVKTDRLNDKRFYLELRHTNSLTRAEYEKLNFTFSPNATGDVKIEIYPDGEKTHWKAFYNGCETEGVFTVSNFDDLRGFGILIPFMGLSCEEIISKGWAKIK